MRAGVLLLVAGCFDPSPTAGTPCSATGACPASLVCTGGFCLPPGSASDAPANDAPLAWTAPIAIDELNTASRDSDPAITADGLEMFFSSSRPGGLGRDDIYWTERATPSSPWDPPTHLTVLATSSTELSVEITGDGQHLWFQSTRSGMGDIYTSDRTGNAWSPPALVNELSSPTEIEADFGVSPDGLAVILSRGDLGSRVLYIATRTSLASPWSTPVPLDDLNNAADDPSAPSLTNGAALVYFHADPVRNIYVATKIGAGYGAPVPVSEVNTTVRDGCPYVPQSNDVLLFERAGDLYYSSR